MFWQRKWCGGLAALAVLALLLWLRPEVARAQAALLTSVSAASNPQTSPATEESFTHLHFNATPKAGEMDLDWKVDPELTHVAAIRIQRSSHNTNDWVLVQSVAADVTSYVDFKIIEGDTYDYRLLAVDDNDKTLDISKVESVVAAMHKNLLQAMKGDTTLTLKDMLDFHFWQTSVNDFVLGTLSFIPKLVVAIVLFGIFWLIYRMIRRLVIGSMSRAHVDPSIRDMLGALIKWSIMGFGLVIACNQVGIEIAALLTGVSIIGLAIGFAAQETLANFIAGVVIFWDKPFKVGDWIIIDGIFGQVLRVSFRSTRILNLNGETLVMPNTYMLANRVANHSTHPMIRVEIPIGIAYKESIDKARAVLLATMDGDERICKEPAPSVVVTQCADSSVNLLLRLWTRDEAVEKNVFFEYLEKSKKALDAAHIEIPFPHMQLMLENTPAIATLAGDSMQPVR